MVTKFAESKSYQIFWHEPNTFLCRRPNGKSHTNKPTSKHPLPLVALGTHLINQCLSLPHWPPEMTARLVHALSHNYATKSSLVTMGCTKFTPKIAPSLGRYPLPSNIPIPQPTPLTTLNGIQIQSSIFHSSPTGQTERQMGQTISLFQHPLTLCIVAMWLII